MTTVIKDREKGKDRKRETYRVKMKLARGKINSKKGMERLEGKEMKIGRQCEKGIKNRRRE